MMTAGLLVSVISIMAILLAPQMMDQVAARKEAEPIFILLRQGKLKEACIASRGLRFVTRTNVVTGIVSDSVIENLPDFKPLSPKAAAMVQREIIRQLPEENDESRLFGVFGALMHFYEHGTLALQDADWKVVEAAMERYNAQEEPRTPFFVDTDSDGKKRVSFSGFRMN